jgi:hypothetical protein
MVVSVDDGGLTSDVLIIGVVAAVAFYALLRRPRSAIHPISFATSCARASTRRRS